MATRKPRGDGTGAVATGGGTEPMARPAAAMRCKHDGVSQPLRP
jgi:hypothetical protein